jgi:hypothetical protein
MNTEIRNEFVSLVQKHFSDLLASGFNLSETSKPLYLVYRSQKIEVVVCLDASLGELEVGFARISSGQRTQPIYGLGEVIKVWDREAGIAFRDPVVRTKAQLEEQLQLLANILRKHGLELLSGNLEALANVDKLRASAGMRIKM